MSDELNLNEVWGLYAEEGGQSLDDIEACLLILQATPLDTDVVARLFRAMHTYKGNARILGLSVIESLAHVSEDMIGLVRDEGVALDAGIINLLLEATDTLRGMLETSASTHKDAAPELADALLARMQEKSAMCLAAKAATTDSVASDAGPTADVTQEPVQSMVFEPGAAKSMADDPLYREIFAGIVHDVLLELRSLPMADTGLEERQTAVTKAVGRLHHAAKQIGMPTWLVMSQDFLAIPQPSPAQIDELLAGLQALYGQDFDVPAAHADTDGSTRAVGSEDPVRRFFDALQQPLGRLSQWRNPSSDDQGMDDIAQAAEAVRGLAADHGFMRVVDVVERVIADAGIGIEALDNHFGRLEFLLYEELASVADVMLEDRDGLAADPRTILRSWCADHVFESLADIRNAMERIKRQEAVETQCTRMIELMRHLYHACLFYGMETAAHLSMSLVDLFARAESDQIAPDAVLLHITNSFIGDMELILDAAGLGESFDMAQIEKLLQEASEATFKSSGTPSSAQIEARLGLPKSFHKVLTPDNVKETVACLDKGNYFYVVRSDLNDDEDLAANFLSWINSGEAQVISNVTVFQGERSLFDFLIASPLNEEGITEALAALDPKGRCLRLDLALLDRNADGHDNGKPDDPVITQAVTMQGTISGDMLESIGELVTVHAMVRHLLNNLFEADLVRSVETELANASNNWQAARSAVLQTLENWQESLDKLTQLELHNSALLNRLQEEAIAVRVRPAGLLLKPLVPFATGLAARHGRQITMTTVGDDTELDYSMLDSLKSALRALVTFCITHSIETPEQRIAAGKSAYGQIRIVLVKQEGHVSITVEDDGVGINLQGVVQQDSHNGRADVSLALREGLGAFSNNDSGTDLTLVRNQLRHVGGDLRASHSPTGGTRFFLALPLAMVVLEGMVVRVGEVQYIVPIDAIQRIVRSGNDELMRVSADNGRYLLRMAANDVLPIHFLRQQTAAENGKAFDRQATPEQEPGDDGDPKHLFVVIGNNQQCTAVSVDELIGQQQVLVRPLQGYLSGIRGVTGCALLGSGEVGMVLDVESVMNQQMTVAR
ncbi:MAG: chemotaxis protein CheW [Methylovulum sp.]|nr:chemotaxis protein CheW [Methylovulum sp.]